MENAVQQDAPGDKPWSVVRARLAPSPTGFLHLGNAWAFLLCALGVRAQAGQLVLRMEDIDPDRSRQYYAQAVIEDLHWLGLFWDEGPDNGGAFGPYKQSHCLHRYAAAFDALTRRGLVYPCYCTRKELRAAASAPHGQDGVYPGVCRNLSPAQRAAREAAGRSPGFRLRGTETFFVFDDLVQGRMVYSWEECGGDFVLRRSDGVFAYQLAVAMDDHAQHISLVVRGRDLVHCTPRQLFLWRLFGTQEPQYAHVPLLLDDQGERLAKRHKSCTLGSLREGGISPLQILGYLGFRAGLLSRPRQICFEELLTKFSWEHVPREDILLPSDIFATLRSVPG